MDAQKTTACLTLIILIAAILLPVISFRPSAVSAALAISDYKYGPIAGDSLVQASDGGCVILARAAILLIVAIIVVAVVMWQRRKGKS